MDTAPSQLIFRLEDRVEGRSIAPGNVDLPTLRQFLGEVETLIKGNVAGASLADSKVTLETGSLLVLVATSSLLAASVQADFDRLAASGDLDAIQPKRAEVIEKWQARVRSQPDRSYSLEAENPNGARLRVDRHTYFEHKELGFWTEVDKYVTGKVTDLGGQVEHNIHLLLPGKEGTLVIAATEQQLKASPFLYEEVTIHIKARQHLEKAKTESHGLGLFVRSLIGLDRQAAKQALGAFLAQGNLRANQIQFLDEVVEHLTEHGCLEAARLYESPYTDFNPQGVEGIFSTQQVDTLISILAEVRSRASA